MGTAEHLPVQPPSGWEELCKKSAELARLLILLTWQQSSVGQHEGAMGKSPASQEEDVDRRECVSWMGFAENFYGV